MAQRATLPAVGLCMADDIIRIAAGLRLGSNLCAHHVCPCGAQVKARGSHGLSCCRSAGRHMRHSQINDIICKALIRAGVSAVKEPPGLLTGSSMRPGGITLIPWVRGKYLAWDATSPDTATRHIYLLHETPPVQLQLMLQTSCSRNMLLFRQHTLWFL